MSARSCPRPDKKAYATEQEALRHRNDLRFRRGGSPDLATYSCACGNWHVGHSRQRLNDRIVSALRYRRTLPGTRRKAW